MKHMSIHQSLAPKHFLDINLLDKAELRKIIDVAVRFKAAGKSRDVLPEQEVRIDDGHVLAMIFEKPSTRTRVSFDMAMRRLGGQSLILNSSEMQLGRGETIADTAKVLSRYVHAIMIRTNEHNKLLELAENATIPVINGLTDDSHPCQIMADIQTFEEHCGPIEGKKVTWIGDGNNMANSWIHAAQQFEFELWLACPDAYSPDVSVVEEARTAGAAIHVTTDIKKAAEESLCLMTDTWVSMGDEDADERHRLLGPYQVNQKIMKLADDKAIFMHCLPAHRGEEVTAQVIDGPQSVIFDETENRMYAQQAILAWCFGLI